MEFRYSADEPAAAGFADIAIERLVGVCAEPPVDPELAQTLTDVLAEARAKFAVEMTGQGLIATIARRAGLNPFETELLAIAVTAESDEQLQRLLVSLTGDRARHRLEVWMLPLLLPGADATLVGPASRLQRAALVSLGGDAAFGRTSVTVAPRVLWAVNGDPTVDPALPVGVTLLLRAEGEAEIAEGNGAGAGAVLVVGPDRMRRRQTALLRSGRRACLAVNEPANEAAWAATVREATLAGAGVVVELDRAADDPLAPEGWRWIERASHLSWALSSSVPLDLEALPAIGWQEYPSADAPASPQEWDEVVGPDVPRLHRLTAAQLHRMRLALTATGGDAVAAYKRLTHPRLETLAQHVRPRAGWDDLILSDDRKDRLRHLVDRYRMAARVYDEWGFTAAPSRGLVALFSGPSGTGKTLAAEVLAGQLGVELYRLDLSAVVSKYIGETEKNLDEVFEVAGIGSFVLFFDEADALFAKRGDVSDSHDRYANVETSYLLQRLERYEGVVVLATNYEKNIDQAFLRRIHVRIDFSKPTESERLAIWQHNLRSSAPVGDDLDVGWLAATFDITGAQIRNAVIDAAFTAAAAGTPIGMATLVRGVAHELEKAGRLVTERQFGHWFTATR